MATIEERAKAYHQSIIDKNPNVEAWGLDEAYIKGAYDQMQLDDKELVDTGLKAYNNGVHDTIEKALKVYEELMTCSGYFPETITSELARMRNKLED